MDVVYMFGPAFGCAQHPKAGRNTQHIDRIWTLTLINDRSTHCKMIYVFSVCFCVDRPESYAINHFSTCAFVRNQCVYPYSVHGKAFVLPTSLSHSTACTLWLGTDAFIIPHPLLVSNCMHCDVAIWLVKNYSKTQKHTFSAILIFEVILLVKFIGLFFTVESTTTSNY